MNQSVTASITLESPVLIHLRSSVVRGDDLLAQISQLPCAESFLVKLQYVD